MTKDDGGGIYTWSGNGTYTNRLIQNNIVVGAIGAGNGTNASPSSHCIYLDGHAMNVNVLNNTISQADASGIFLNNGNSIKITGNTIYNLPAAYNLNRMPNEPLLRNNVFTSNICYPTESNLFYWNGQLNTPVTTDIQSDMRAIFSTIDSNFYRDDISAPFDWYYHLTDGGTFVDPSSQNLTTWKTTIAADKNSKAIGTAIPAFYFNATKSSVVYNFSGLSKKDLYGTIYNNSVTIAPFASKALISNGTATTTNQAPVSKAGADFSITLPVNTATLTGTGTDTDGIIAGYVWKKIVGPATGNIATPNAASTSLNSLVQGIYQFELTVTDDKSATGKDTLQVAVNAANTPNQIPVSNAGADISITLPVNTAAFAGTGTDTDGTISNYAWVEIAGSTTGTIATPNAGSTSLSSLVQGIYQFELTVTDDKGALGKDTVQLTVNAAPVINLLPVVNPANTVKGIDYKYYEGSWSLLPIFESLNPVKSGTAVNFDVSLANKTTLNGFSFSGYINVPVDGQYTFYTSSDDGSSLYIDNLLTVNNDGQHGIVEKSGIIGLKAGKHFIKALYFQAVGGQVFTVSYQGNGFAKKVIPNKALYRINNLTVAKSTNTNTVGLSTPLSLSETFKASCYPNPTTTDFGLKIEGGSNEKVEIIVANAEGHIVYKTIGTSNKIYRFGYDLVRGFYIIKVVQGNLVQTLKIIKL
jgi:parallel beta-helix repeat protein